MYVCLHVRMWVHMLLKVGIRHGCGDCPVINNELSRDQEAGQVPSNHIKAWHGGVGGKE